MPEEPEIKTNDNNSLPETPQASAAPKNSPQDTLLQAVAEVEKETRSPITNKSESQIDNTNPHPEDAQPSRPARNKKKLVVLSLAAVILLVFSAAGSAFALWYNNPDKVVSDAVVSVATARTAIANGSYQFKDEKNKGSVNLTFDSKTDTPNLKGQLDASLKVNYDKYNFNLAGSGLLSEKGNLYFKFDGVKKVLDNYIEEPEIKSYIEASPELKADILAFAKKIDGQWIKLDEAAIKTMWSDFNHGKTKACFTDAYEKIENNASQRAQVTNAYDQNRFIIIQDKGNQSINGVDSMKYNVTADVTKYNKASDAFEKTEFGKNLQKCSEQLTGEKRVEKNTSADQKYRDESAKDDQKEIDKAKLTVWVSRWGHEFTKTTFVRDDAKEKTHTALDINYKLNQKIDAKDPEKSIPLKEFQTDIDNMQKSLTNIQETTSASQADTAR